VALAEWVGPTALATIVGVVPQHLPRYEVRCGHERRGRCCNALLAVIVGAVLGSVTIRCQKCHKDVVWPPGVAQTIVKENGHDG
jgi:hypothetical protein